MNATQSSVFTARQWKLQMGLAAQKYGLTIQVRIYVGTLTHSTACHYGLITWRQSRYPRLPKFESGTDYINFS